MKKIISLIKVFFKVNIKGSSNTKKKSRIFLLIGFGIYLLFIFSNFWKLFIQPLKQIEQEAVSINLIINISSMFILMTSITYIVNILYFSNDMENIIPFPFKSREIFTAKLSIAYFYELMIATMVSLPGFLIYGLELGMGVEYYVLAFLVFILLPIFSIAILTIFYTILMQFFKVNHYKNFFKIFSTIIILIAIVAFQMNLNANMLANGEYDGNYILEMCNNLNNAMPYYLKIATNIFENVGGASSIISLIWFVIINFCLIGITIFGFDKLYMRAVYYHFGDEIKANHKGKLNYKQQSKFQSFVSKDLKNLFRNVTFFIQCVLPTSFMPAVILITMLSSGSSNEITLNMNSTPVIKMLFGFLIIQFFMMMNQISATAVSRDGEDETVYLKALPFPISKQLDGKAMPSIYVGIFNLVIAMIFNLTIFTLNLIEVLLLIMGGILLNFIQSYTFLILDIRSPKLRWESEVAVVKHNMNVLKAILLWFGMIIVTTIIGNIFLICNAMYFDWAYIVFLLVIYAIIKKYLRQNSEQIYEKIY